MTIDTKSWNVTFERPSLEPPGARGFFTSRRALLAIGCPSARRRSSTSPGRHRRGGAMPGIVDRAQQLTCAARRLR